VNSAASAPIRLPSAPPALAAHLSNGGAVAWREPIEIGTYEPGEPDRYPMFLDQRVYQGSSGRVYPLPFVDSVSHEKSARVWDAIHLENEWIRLVVLPELGGRIHVGYDKKADYDFFYRNNVIKPALVGLAGPWVSGGVEFNWPQHHRPATFLPVECTIEHGDDGSVTVWSSDHDPFARMKGMHGVRLHPDRAVIELVVRLHNRTSETQTFLWWANVAARVHDDYQSFFPTDVQWVADHARRSITAFPQADREYYGVDYPARGGADRLDFYRDIPVPTSYMVTSTRDDFFGGYDHARGAGFVHWADRHIAPGKKQWTWGNAPFGHAWDALLTDDDGPYVELMAGVYTDNQPDFAWIRPGETKTFSQYWYPIQGVGVVHQANLDAAVHLSVAGGSAHLGVATTAVRPAQRIRLVGRGDVLAEWTADVAPGTPFIADVATALEPHELTLEVVGLISWTPRVHVDQPEPEPATEPARPADIDSVDELYLTGLHLAQYRHPTWSPLDYWHEALRRDPGDARSHLALAEHHHRRADYPAALRHAEAALTRLTVRNGNPVGGEASYRLGLVLCRLGRGDDAYDALSKAAWNGEWRQAASVELARLDARAGRYADAQRHATEALRRDADDSRARALLAIALRRQGGDADPVLAEALALDPLDQLALHLAGRSWSDDAAVRLDVAIELAAAGELEAAIGIAFGVGGAARTAAGNEAPIALYLAAAWCDRLGRTADATAARSAAREVDATLAFPSLLEHHDALVAALDADETDPRAHSLLGSLLYHHGRHAEALAHWLRSVELDPTDPVTLRNSAIASVNHGGDADGAVRLYDLALELAPGHARLWYESDQLWKRLGRSAADRLARIPSAALHRDDLAVETAELLTATGRAGDALALLLSRPFAPWEGGEGRALAAWDGANAALGNGVVEPPASLGEARPAFTAPAPVRTDGTTDYFATSLPDLLLFTGRTVS
jgi:tetratricopeptide (TPR) repeat protein